MNIIRILIRPMLYAVYGLHRLTGTGTFATEVARFAEPPPPAAANPLKLALWKHHVKQFHESSCSVASVVACVNAIKEVRGLGPLLDQQEILDMVRAGHWRERMTDTGYRGRRGVPLPLLGEIVRESLRISDIQVRDVVTVQASRNPDRIPAIREELEQRLLAFEQGRALIIAHFDQGSFLRALNIPHISPVGGFDPGGCTVTILDVDPELERPYAVAFDIFYRGLSCNFLNVFRIFGYGSGGYVAIELE